MSMPFEINKTYNFNTLAPTVLGTSYKNAKVLAIMDYVLASKYISPETEHVNIFPLLPVGTPNNPKKYTYVVFKSEAGIVKVLALEWIDVATVILVTSQVLTAVVQNVSSGDAVRIRDALLLLGFTSITVSVT